MFTIDIPVSYAEKLRKLMDMEYIDADNPLFFSSDVYPGLPQVDIDTMTYPDGPFRVIIDLKVTERDVSVQVSGRELIVSVRSHGEGPLRLQIPFEPESGSVKYTRSGAILDIMVDRLAE